MVVGGRESRLHGEGKQFVASNIKLDWSVRLHEKSKSSVRKSGETFKQ